MVRSEHRIRGYVLAILSGALVSGIFVAILSRTFPKLMQGMMENMCVRMAEMMGEQGITPSEMCQRMMAGHQALDSNVVLQK